MLLAVVLELFLVIASTQARYEPNWASLDARPLPSWYDEAKIGIFIHWGVFSVPSFGSEWFWKHWQGFHFPAYVHFMKENYKPGFTYQEFAPMFTAEFFEPTQWAEMFQASGARYVVLTSKHHEGYTMWPSKASWNWNVMDVGPKRDLVGELAAAVRNVSEPSLRFGLYHSMFEWFNPLYLSDQDSDFTKNTFAKTKTIPELMEIVTKYKPHVIWSDGDAEAPDTYWHSTSFLAWLFNDSPVKDEVVVNDRWGRDCACKHGSFYTCSDRYNPGHLLPHKWENCMTLDYKSWGYRREAQYSDYMPIEELIRTIVETVSCGGNILINVGPTKEGTIPAIMEERLRQMGKWLAINGEGIYGSKAWQFQNDTLTEGVWYTQKTSSVYAFFFHWPSDNILTLGSVEKTADSSVTLLGDNRTRTLAIEEGVDGMEVTLPPRAEQTGDWVWALEMHGVLPSPQNTFRYHFWDEAPWIKN